MVKIGAALSWKFGRPSPPTLFGLGPVSTSVALGGLNDEIMPVKLKALNRLNQSVRSMWYNFRRFLHPKSYICLANDLERREV